jgi:diguanylate cyclase (GGDEF)-like protein/PAS domain S-box-containing protein
MAQLNQALLDAVGAASERVVVEIMISAGRQLLGADFGWCFMKEEQGENFYLFYKSPNTEYTPIPKPRKNGIVSRAFRSRRPQIVENVPGTAYIRFDAKAAMQSVAVIPITYKDADYGTLHLAFLQPHTFTQEEITVCSLLGNCAAQAMTVQRLYSDLQGFKQTLDNASDCICMLNPATLRIQYANAGAERQLGYSEKTLLGRRFTEIVSSAPLSDTPDFKAVVDGMVFHEAGSTLLELTLVKADGTRMPAEAFLQYIPRTHEHEGRLLMVARNVGERTRTEPKFEPVASFDPLTGLPGRVAFMHILAQRCTGARAREQFGVLVLNVDKFQAINNIFGHVGADQLLIDVAARLTDSLEAFDVVARMGGDEFVLLLGKLKGANMAVLRANAVLAAFQEPFAINGREVFVSLSAGFAVFPFEGQDENTLLLCADTALHWVKNKGGAGCERYVASMASIPTERLLLEQQLRSAMRQNQLILHYQPQRDVRSGNIVRVEGVLRWEHPERGLMYPDEFMELADEAGISRAISQWGVEELLRQSREWQETSFPAPPLAVHISRRHFAAANFADQIERALEAHEVKPKKLVLEVSEAALIRSMDHSRAVLTQLKKLRVEVYVDAFGRGYTSLGYLPDLPVSGVKIDASLIAGVGQNVHAETVITAMISIAHDMRLEVVCDGVEVEAQVEFLKTAGADVIQGGFVSSFLPSAEVPKFIVRQVEGPLSDR